MVKKLQRKFVLVTVTMMALLFAGFWIAGRVYQDYWYDQEMLTVVEVLADSGLLGDKKDIDSEMIVEGLTDEEPIVYLKVNTDGEILSQRHMGQYVNKNRISGKIVRKMLESGKDGYREDGYIYTKRVLSDGNILIVAIDSAMNDGDVVRIIGTAILVLIGVTLLTVITFCLSGFVTLPAKEALAREKRFISDASHELKTPLGAISINAQALELNAKDSVYIRNILSETGRMNRLIENLLTLSKIEETGGEENKAFSLSEVVQEMVLSYESIAFEKERTLCSEIQEDIQMYGNDDEIRQLLAILIDNAIKNSEENGEIMLQCIEDSGHKIITVRNDGKGITEEDIGHVFQRFYTTDQSRSKGSFGLGLAIAREIVEKHGGKIEVSSIPDQETVFTVRF